MLPPPGAVTWVGAVRRPGHNWRLAGSRLRIEITVDFNAGTVRDMDAVKNVQLHNVSRSISAY